MVLWLESCLVRELIEDWRSMKMVLWLERCLKSIERVLRGCLWRDETDFGCSNPFKVRPFLLGSVANTADLAAPAGLDSNDPLIGSRWKDPCADWHLDSGLRLG